MSYPPITRLPPPSVPCHSHSCNAPPFCHHPLFPRVYLDWREHGILYGILVHIRLGRLVKRGAVAAKLLGDAVLERVVGQGLHEQVAHGVEHGRDLGRRLPVLRLQQAQAYAPQRVVGHVGVVDARGEFQRRRLEWVVGRQREDEPEAAWVVDGFRRRGERDVPCVERFRRWEGNGEVFRRGLGEVGVFLRDPSER